MSGGDLATPGFPTMAADSVSNTSWASTYSTAPNTPAAPTNLTATLQAGPRVSLTWRDNATNEAYFVVERCSIVAPETTCSNFAQIAAPGPRTNTGNVTYVDTTVLLGNSYLYQVAAVNPSSTPSTSQYATLANAVLVPAVPAAPTSFKAANTPANGPNSTMNLTWVHDGLNVTNFTIQRATQRPAQEPRLLALLLKVF